MRWVVQRGCNSAIVKQLSKTNKFTSIPSSTRIVVSKEEEDSIDKTPSGPTFPIASAIIVPTKSSFPADIEATAVQNTSENALAHMQSYLLY